MLTWIMMHAAIKGVEVPGLMVLIAVAVDAYMVSVVAMRWSYERRRRERVGYIHAGE